MIFLPPTPPRDLEENCVEYVVINVKAWQMVVVL